MPRDGLLEWSGHSGRDLKGARVAQSKQTNSMCQGPQVRALLGTFCQTARRSLCGWSRKGEGLAVGGRQRRSRLGQITEDITGHRENFAFTLGQGTVAKFFCKGPHDKYFRLCRPYSLCCSCSTLLL